MVTLEAVVVEELRNTTVCDCNCHEPEYRARAITVCPHCCDPCYLCGKRIATGEMKDHVRFQHPTSF